MKYQKSWTQAVQEVYNISEDAKMGKQSDDQLKKIYKTAMEKDQSSPANKSFTQRIAKEMKKRGINEIRWDLKEKGPAPAAEIIKGAGKQLKDYALKSGGIDKKDFLTTADVLLKGKIPTEKQIPSDTAPREFVHGLMARKFGWKYVEQKYGIKFTNRKVYPEEVEVDDETELKEADYELYHKTFSGAMQHAYAHAKKKGFTVDPDEIDNKVAVGPKKPSSGKTNRYILGTDKKKKVHIQVANLDNKKYELNMYIEETQSEKDNMNLNETIRRVLVNEILKKGDTVTVPHKGKLVKGKVVRYDKGGPEDPFYVVDVGENESPKIPAHKIKEDSDDTEPGTQGDKEEYAKKRDAVLKKYGVKSCAQCETEEEKKACFNDLDDAHVADHEESYAQTPGQEPSKQKVGVKKKAKEPQEQKEQSKLLSHIRKLMKGA